MTSPARKRKQSSTLEIEMKDRAAFILAFDPTDPTDQAAGLGRDEEHVVALDIVAPALMDVSALVQAANYKLNGGKIGARVSINASPREGSLEILLILDIGLLDRLMGLLTWEHVSKAADILQILGVAGKITTTASAAGLSGLGLIQLVRAVRGRAIEMATPRGDGTTALSVHGDHNTIIVHNNVYNLFTDVPTRNALGRVARTARKPGVEALEFRSPGAEKSTAVERIEAEESDAFEAPTDPSALEPSEIVVPPSTRRAALEVTKVWLREGRHKWQFSDGSGGAIFNAEIRDEQFLGAVNAGQVGFKRGDVLIVDLSSETLRSQSGLLRTNYAIEKVNEIQARPVQLTP